MRFPLIGLLILGGLLLTEPAPAAEPDVIRFATVNANYRVALEEIIRRYQARNPHLKVELSVIGQEFATWIRTRVAAGGDLVPDIYNGNYTNGYDRQGRWVALDPITNVEVIRFRTKSYGRRTGTRWGYGEWLADEEVDSTGAITRISTDEGIQGHMLGGDKANIEGSRKNLLVGENPLNREKLWHWMDQMATFGHGLSEHVSGLVDCALWDLAGQKAGLPVYQLLGGSREKIEAYASTHPNLGGPEVYIELARDCVKTTLSLHESVVPRACSVVEDAIQNKEMPYDNTQDAPPS